MTACRTTLLVLVVVLTVGSGTAAGEPRFLSKQYPRCTTCHFSPTGGGLLTPYGRSLSHRELSTTGDRSQPGSGSDVPVIGEESAFWGLFKDSLGPVQLGLDLRAARLSYSSEGFSFNRNLLMNADLIGAVKSHGWTGYGQIGREPLDEGSKIISYEYWGGREWNSGFAVRAGRYLPAYGVKFADHTSFNRSELGLTQYDQIYGVEVSHTSERSLLQVSLSPGRAEDLLDDASRRSFTASAREQIDFGSRTVLVGSGLFRGATDLDPRSAAGGLALGIAPIPKLSIWTQGDVVSLDEPGATTLYVVVNETAFEIVRGIWLTISPQLRSGGASGSSDIHRLVLGADFLPRTHFNFNIGYYRDTNQTSDLTSTIVLLQAHFYP